MKKSTKNKIVNVVDFTNIYCLEDIDKAVFNAKFANKLTEDELYEITDAILDSLLGTKDALVRDGYKKYMSIKFTYSLIVPNDIKVTFEDGKFSIKKPSLFKRMWNKLFKKNK